MAENNGNDQLKIEMDLANLYSEEIVTDRKVGTIHVLTPITPEGQKDVARPMVFLGETQIMSQLGPLPISFEIPAETVADAVKGYGEAAEKAIKNTIERIREAQLAQSQKIVTPDMPGFKAPDQGGGLVMP